LNFRKLLFIGIASIFFIDKLSAQSLYSVGSLPVVNINTAVGKKWDLNMRMESRQIYKTEIFGEASVNDFRYELNDYAAILTYRSSPVTRVGAGYLIRIRNNEVFHRAIQQFTIVDQLGIIRLAHRISTDQTFSSNRPAEYRLRYRISLEIPLNGQTIDNRELYIRFNNEYLGSVEENAFDLEVRVVPLLGINLTSNNKLETGLDYRTRSFIGDTAIHNFWFTVNWFIRI